MQLRKKAIICLLELLKIIKVKKIPTFVHSLNHRDESGVPRHRVLINFGQVDKDAVPYLKAAFAKKKPRLVYDDE